MTTEVTPLLEQHVAPTHRLLYQILEELHSKDPWALQSYKTQHNASRMRSLTSESNASHWVAEDGGEVVGFGIGRISAGVGFINWMGVEKQHRKHGIGTMILERMQEDFRRRGCHKVELYTYQNNDKLQAFYRKRGYQVIALLNNHYFRLDVVYMTLDLTDKLARDART